MKAIIRADAGAELGSGHVMRCLALAEALSTKGFELAFVCRQTRGHMADVISARGYGVHLLPAQLSEAEDAEETLKVVHGLGTVKWIIVDHYGLGLDWQQRVRDENVRVLAMTDSTDGRHVADIVVNQNLGADALLLEGRTAPHTVTLFGSRYALLRSEFLQHKPLRMATHTERPSILVSFGGMDHTNETTKFLDAWDMLDPDASAEIVIGALHPHAEDIRARIAHDDRLKMHVQIDYMAKLMFRSDLAVGTAGTTSWERCFAGLPSIMVTTADNQSPIAHELAANGAGIHLGDAERISAAQLAAALNHLLLNPAVRSLMAQQASQIIDGGGSRRIATLMENLTHLTARKATVADSETMFSWRNDPTVRQVSTDSQEINWSDHSNWLQQRLSSPDTHLLIIERKNVPVGVTRFDIDRLNATAEVSLYLDPQLQGKGLGPAVYRTAENWLLRQETDIRTLTAVIQNRNHASKRLFNEQGFQAKYSHFRKIMGDVNQWKA